MLSAITFFMLQAMLVLESIWSYRNRVKFEGALESMNSFLRKLQYKIIQINIFSQGRDETLVTIEYVLGGRI